jgi:hypothetical protein
MSDNLKEQQSELTPQRYRNAAGAWVNGETYKEQSKATQQQANSDHGDFEKSSIDKKNS